MRQTLITRRAYTKRESQRYGDGFKRIRVRGNKGNYSCEPVEQQIIGTAGEERRKTYKEKIKH